MKQIHAFTAMVLSADNDLRTHLENGLATNVSAYVENKLKRFGLYRRTTIHSGTPVAQKAFGNRIKCLDTLLRESGKLLVCKLPITALSRDESYDMHLKVILKAEWSTYGILVVDNEGRKHRDYYISTFLGAADVRISVQKIYHKSRLELFEELQNTIKIMPCKISTYRIIIIGLKIRILAASCNHKHEYQLSADGDCLAFVTIARSYIASQALLTIRAT